MTLPPSRPERVISTYRGFRLIDERMGHTNIETDAGFYGGHRTHADAVRAVDQIIRQRDTITELITLSDGRIACRVTPPEIRLPDGTTYEGRLQRDDDGAPIVSVATCDACGFTWNDELITSVTPTPAGRCPNEYAHDDDDLMDGMS